MEPLQLKPCPACRSTEECPPGVDAREFAARQAVKAALEVYGEEAMPALYEAWDALRRIQAKLDRFRTGCLRQDDMDEWLGSVKVGDPVYVARGAYDAFLDDRVRKVTAARVYLKSWDAPFERRTHTVRGQSRTRLAGECVETIPGTEMRVRLIKPPEVIIERWRARARQEGKHEL